MSNIRVKMLSLNEKGLISITVTMVFIMVASLTVLGFSQVARRNSSQALDRQLSSQAFYAAESAVNDAVSKIVKDLETGTKPQPQGTCSGAYTVNGGKLEASGGDIKYTCLKVITNLSAQTYSNVTSTVAVPLNTSDGSNLGSNKIVWTRNATAPKTAALSKCVAKNSLPSASAWASNCPFGLLRVDVVPMQSETIASAQAAAAKTMTVFLYPRSGNSATSVPYRNGGINPYGTDVTQGAILYGSCSEDTCEATVSGLDFSKAFMRIQSIYNPAQSVQVQTTVTNQTLSGGQVVIDATGKAQDVLRRIRVNYPLVGSSRSDVPNFAANALQSSGSICKYFSVAPGYFSNKDAICGSTVTSTTPTTPPVITPPPSTGGGGGSSGKLRWRPPAGYEKYTKIYVPANGDQLYNLNANTDYQLIFPNGIKHGGVNIRGGRNIVIMGAHIVNDIPITKLNDYKTAASRGLFLWDNAGSDGKSRTIYIEGMFYEGSDGVNDPSNHTDGIGINAKSATVTIQNSKFINLRGSAREFSLDAAGNVHSSDEAGYAAKKSKGEYKFFRNDHSDMVQPFGGVKNLQIDRFTGSTSCQGFLLAPDGGSIGKVDLSNIDLTYQDLPPGCGDLLWLTDANHPATKGYCTSGSPIILQNFYVEPGKRGTLPSAVWPKTAAANKNSAACGFVMTSATTGTWPGLPLSGSVTKGSPPGGSYVPKSAVSMPYASPGYL